MKNLKRFLSFTLALVMCFNMIGTTAFAETTPTDITPTEAPAATPVVTAAPTAEPTAEPTEAPTATPVVTEAPTEAPTEEPTPTAEPTEEPTPTAEPTEEPTPTAEPTEEPTPTVEPTEEPTPTAEPTEEPTPTVEPTEEPTPTVEPTEEPTPTAEPTEEPTPTVEPTEEPTPTVDPVVAALQAKMNAVPTTCTSEEERAVIWAAMDEIEPALEALTAEQREQLDYTNYNAAMDAAAAFTNPEFDEQAVFVDSAWRSATSYVLEVHNDASAVTKAELYALLVEKYGEPTTNVANKGGVKYGSTTLGVWNQLDTGSAGLAHGSTYAVQLCTKITGSIFTGGYKETWTDKTAFTVEVYDILTVNTTIDGATTSETVKVFRGTTHNLTVAAKDGYNVKVSGAVTGEAAGTYEISGLTADATVNIDYTDATVKSKVYLSVNGTEHGTAHFEVAGEKVESGAELAKGTVVTVVATANGESNNSQTYTTTISGVDANNQFVVGDTDTTITVTFTANILAVTESHSVEYNGYYTGANASGYPLSKLEANILEALGIQYNGADVESATIQFYPRYVGKNTDGEMWSDDSAISWLLDDNVRVNLNADIDEVAIGSYGYDGKNFGERAYNDGAALKSGIKEKVRITYEGLYVEAEITLTESRKAYTLQKPEMSVTFESQTDIDSAVLAALNTANAGQTITATIKDGQTLPTDGETATLTYNVTVAANADHLGCTDTVTIAATAKSNPANITFTAEGTGSGSVNFGGLTANGTLAAGTYTLTVTPADLDGSDGSAMYVDSVAVTNGTLTDGTWANGVYTASVTVDNDTDVTVTITYGTAALNLSKAEVAINGYYENNGDWDNSLAAVKGLALQNTGAYASAGGSITDYKVVVSYSSDATIDLDDTSVGGGIARLAFLAAVNVTDGSEGYRSTTITKAATDKVVALTATTSIKLVDSRKAATIVGGTVNGQWNNLADFKADILTKLTAFDGEGTALDKSNVTLGDLVQNDDGKYTVTAQVTTNGATWLPSEETILGLYEFDYIAYNVIFVDHEGNEIHRYTLDNESTPSYTGTTDMVAYYDAKDTAEWDWTFTGWTPDFSALNGADVTYTATYNRVVEKYTITWVNGDETTTEEYEYGATPVAPEASKTSTAQYHFTNGTWGTIATVTCDATYTATFTEELRSYTITWKLADEFKWSDDSTEETKTTDVAYGVTPVAPEAIKADKVDDDSNVMETYTANWGEVKVVDGDAEYTVSGVATKAKYVISWVIDGVESAVEYEYGTKLERENPSKNNYIFLGWDVDGDGKYTEGETLPVVTKDATYTAIFRLETVIAMIGDNEYGSIQEAVEAAKDGETVKVVKSHQMDFADGVYNSDGEFMLVNVAHKNITINLNGHTVSVDMTELPGSMLAAVFSADVGGKLTLKGGTVKVTGSTESKKLYSMVMAYAGQVNITSGRYEADYMTSGRGMIYGQVGYSENKGVHVSGGTFKLGNVGTLANGSPWIMATAGSNSGKYVYVTGGTFNDDILHQHYIFEAEAPKERALKNNGDGTWTMVDAVAYVNEYQYSSYYTQTGYDTLNAAIAAADNNVSGREEFVTLLEDAKLQADATLNASVKLESGKSVALNLGNKAFDLNSYAVILDAGQQLTIEGDGMVTNAANLLVNGVVIKGGTYDADPAAYLHEDYIRIDVGEGKWKVVPGEYTITWDAGEGLFADGKKTITSTVKYGEMPASSAAPVKASTDDFAYDFVSWTPEVVLVTEAVTYTATYKAVNIYDITFIYGNGEEDTVLHVRADDIFDVPADPSWEAHLFTQWDKTVVNPATGNANYSAIWADDVDKDSVIDGSEEDPYWTVTVDGETVSTTTLNGEYATPAAPSDKANMFFVEWSKAVDEAAHTITFTSIWNTNDANDNNVDDASETADVTVVIEGNGTVTLTPAGNATQVKQDGNVYTYLYDSTDDANKVINVTATPTDTTATDGSVDYVISAPATVNVGETVTAKFGTVSMVANNGTVKINKYYTANSKADALATLRTDILTAAGLDPNGSYVVTAVVGIQSLGDWATWTVEVKDGDAVVVKGTDWLYSQGYLANELNKASYSFTISYTEAGQTVSKSVTMQMVDSRAVVAPQAITVSEQKDLGYMTNDNILADVKAAVGDLSLGTPSITAGALPVNAGEETSVTYSVKFDGDATYQAATITITYEKVYKAYNDCTVSADSSLTANGSMTINGSTNATVSGNSTVTITVKPNSDKIVESITVTNKTTGETVDVSAITYSSQSATVTFTSGGATAADEYVVSATYSDKYLNLVSGTIVYCVDDKDHTYDLQKLVFEAIFGGSCAPMTKDNVKLEYQYAGGDLIKLWADVSKDPSINLDGVTHKFGEDGSEIIKLTYSDDKYGSFEQQIELNVFDSCYNVTVGVNTVTNGANATIKTQYSADAREYLNVAYFKAGTELTVTLTPDGELLNILKQAYNGTYAEKMAYIKAVTVTDKDGNAVDATLTRGQGKLSLDSILDGVNPMLFNAAVTFTLDPDEDYTVTVEYGIHELPEASDAQLPMYQGGKDYDAEVPTAEELINAILSEDEAAEFLATYGGAYTVEFTKSLLANEWTAVSDEELLALSDGSKITVRITWKPGDTNMIYYPVATTAEITLVDQRTPTSVQGEVPEKQVNFISEDKLIAELKEAMGLGILANDSALEVDYTVTYTLKGNETDGLFVDVTVSYDGSAEYKPTSKSFENVPVANRPDDATIKMTIQNASDVVTNNDGKIQTLDTTTGIYTVIGNGTYNFKFTPATGYAIEAVYVETVDADEVVVTSTTDLIAETEVPAGEKVELTYAKQTASFSMVLNEDKHYEVVVVTVSSVWGLEEEPTYDFATGVMTPDNSDIVEAVTTYPTDIDFEKVAVEYMARAEGKVTVTLPDIDLGFIVIPLGSFDIDLGELWLNPEESVDMVSEDQLDKILENLTEDIIYKVSMGELDATKAFDYIQNYVKNLPLGIHAFGENGDGSTETIRFSYEDDKYLLAQVQTNVTIHDYRIATEIAASDCEVTFGYSLAQLIAASGAQVKTAEGVVSGLTIETDDLYKHVGTHEMTLTFAGDVNYQPSKVTINVTVNKAPASIDYDSQIITYGDDYDFALSVSPTTMPDGTKAEIDRIEFMIGLDMAKLLDVDIEDKDVGINELAAFVQLRLPESIRNLPLVGQYLQGEFSLSEFGDLINSLDDVLGIDEESMGILNEVLEAIAGTNIKVIVKDEAFHPTNIGVYIAGAVTVDADFETAYTADYLIVKPRTTQATLAWDYEDENGILTMPALEETYADLLGAHVVEEDIAAKTNVKYLIFGINRNGESDFLTTDVYGNIKANIWTSPDAVKDNGAYVQIAYLLNWGNEIFYAVPLVRSFVVVPKLVTVQLVGANGDHNRDLLKTFNGQPQGFSVKAYDGETLIYSDHYQDLVDGKPYVAGNETGKVVVTYTGLQTNGQLYGIDGIEDIDAESIKTFDDLTALAEKFATTEKPVHAGVYAVTATYYATLNENLYSFGADAGVLVIEPSESTITMEESVIKTFDFDGYNVEKTMNIVADSVSAPDKYVTEPDKTIITASIASTGDFSENGWDAITGTVNVDFPAWVDELIAQYAPSIVDGMSASEFGSKLNGKADEIAAALIEQGAPEEVADVLNSIFGEIDGVLSQLPENVTLSFKDDYRVNAVGAYVVIGVVTDSDHYPAVDAGLLVIQPDVKVTELKWNYEDENYIFTRELLELEYVDLYASAYADGVKDDAATDLIVHQFVTIDETGDPIFFQDAAKLPYGAYIELAYIPLEAAGNMTVSDLIARPVILTPNMADVQFIDLNANDMLLRKFDNEEQTFGKDDITVTFNGETIEVEEKDLTFYYTGVQTNGKVYEPSETAPIHAGAYVVTVVYMGEEHVGMDVIGLGIEPAESTIQVTGKTVTYDGNGHTAEVVTTGAAELKPDYTLISGGAYVSGDISEIGVDAFHGNVNIDFPRWLEEVMTEKGIATEGLNADDLIAFIEAAYDELVAKIPVEDLVKLGADEAEINAYIEKHTAHLDELLSVMDKLPKDVTLTFNDGVTYTEPGYYFYYGIVTDSDHYPSTDTGLLVIEKMDAQFGAWHEIVPYDGKEHTVYVPNDEFNVEGAPAMDYMTMVLDRQNNTVNIILEADLEYVKTTVERLLDIEIPDEITVEALNEVLADAGVTMDDLAKALVDVLNAVQSGMEKPEEGTKEYAESTYRDIEVLKKLFGYIPADAKLTFNGQLPVEVGTYEFYLYGYSQYYKSGDASATLFIEPIRIVVDDKEDGKVYGETDPELTANVTCYSYIGREDPFTSQDYVGVEGYNVGGYYDGSALNQDASYDTIVWRKTEITELPEDVLSYTVTREAGEDVGEYDMQVAAASVSDTKNYVVEIVEDDTKFTITPAEVTITVADATKVYGEADPELTWTAETTKGVVSEEELGVVVARAAGEDVGEYAITAAYKMSGNFNVTANIGTFTITKAPVTVQVNNVSKTYGEADPAFTSTVTGLKNGDELTISYSREVGENAGEYAITAEAEHANYAITFVNGTLTINKALAAVKVDDVTKVYGEADPEEFTYAVTGLVNDDTEESLGIEVTRAEGENVGEYDITATAENANYAILSNLGKMSITPATLTVKVDDAEKVEGTADPEEFTYAVTGLVNDDTEESLGIEVTREEGETVGTYSYIVTITNTNYLVTMADDTGVFTITNPYTVKANDVSTIICQVPAAEAFTYTVYEEVEGERVDVTADVQNSLNVSYTIYTVDENGAKVEIELAEAVETAGTYAITPVVTVNDETNTYTVVVEDGTLYVNLFDFYATNVNAGDNLDIMFAFAQSNISDANGYYVEIVREYADDTTETVEIPYDSWGERTIGKTDYYCVTYGEIAAKEMCDVLTATVYNSKGQAVSNPWSDSIRDYAMRRFGQVKTDVERAVFIDLLNYGAAVQKLKNHNTSDLANGKLTAEQQAYASTPKAFSSTLDRGDKWLFSNLDTVSHIQFWVMFDGLNTDMYATVEYTDHYNRQISKTISGADFKVESKTGNYYLDIRGLVYADARQVLNITIYNADGTVYTTCQESMEDYFARNNSKNVVYGKTMQFCDSAYAYFHRNDK